jgi:riboflavin kinase
MKCECMEKQTVKNEKPLVCLKGKVFSGTGEGAKFIELPWVKRQIEEKLGFVPYPGTLNIKLSKDKVKLKNLLKGAKPIEILPAEGYCLGKCFKAHLANGLECAIVLPQVRGYPEGVIEVIAPVNLREKLQLKDGDIIEVIVAS